MQCQGKRKDGQPCRQVVGVSAWTGLCRHHNTREGWAAAHGIRALTGEDILMADDRGLILNEPIETDEGPVSVIPILREGDEAPWGGTFKWADERPTCRHVQNFLHQGTEPPGDECPEYKDGICRSASIGAPLPCLFHEDLDSEGWKQARNYRRIPCPTDADPDGWGLAHKDHVYYPDFEGQELEPMFAGWAGEAAEKAITQVREQLGIPEHVPLDATVQAPGNIVRIFARSIEDEHEPMKTKAASPMEGSAA
ncbi:MAG TPA: hypothetical protein EYP49_16350 [Anaerolineae bacterium]|nr:hypothetical protein [Anaerolineae bacterium]